MHHQILLTDLEFISLGLTTLFALTLAHLTIFLWINQEINDIKQQFKRKNHHAIKN
jgi:hypothetical protein